jgi:hypothetical protein
MKEKSLVLTGASSATVVVTGFAGSETSILTSVESGDEGEAAAVRT